MIRLGLITQVRLRCAKRCPHSVAEKQTSAASFNHLIGDGEHARRNGQPERLGRFQVDDQVELGRLHNRKIARLFTFENPPA